MSLKITSEVLEKIDIQEIYELLNKIGQEPYDFD